MHPLFLLFIILLVPLNAIEFEKLKNFPLGDAHLIQGASNQEDVIICCHGYGGDWKLAHTLSKVVPYHVIGFNFPDYGDKIAEKTPEALCFGTLKELQPLIKLMQTCATNGCERIHLYGFSAGGGAVVNALAVLNTGRHPSVTDTQRKAILTAVEQGTVLLDCPLKSIEEIIEIREEKASIRTLSQQYVRNQLVPIDSLECLKSLQLTVLLHFQQPDATLTNRDDALYANRLTTSNSAGRTLYICGQEGAHRPCLPSFAQAIKKL
ncbi:MAG: hypothetical protein S4CHLAM2_18310 [Chlamydiales bacterium]|nr:hypothetical protein [Chlamydiales bacterium]